MGSVLGRVKGAEATLKRGGKTRIGFVSLLAEIDRPVNPDVGRERVAHRAILRDCKLNRPVGLIALYPHCR